MHWAKNRSHAHERKSKPVFCADGEEPYNNANDIDEGIHITLIAQTESEQKMDFILGETTG